jgi:hypothetical protein
VLLRVVKRLTEDTPVKMILNIVSYAATGYLVVVAFVVALPFGLVASIATAITTSVIVSFIGDPSSLMVQVQEFLPQSHMNPISNLSKRVVQTGDGSTFIVNSSNSIIVINSDYRNRVVELMRTRSRLPISLTHFEDLDVLFIATDRDRSMFDRVSTLLRAHEIETKGPTPALLAEAIQMIPIIDEQNGLMMKGYRITKDEKTVENLLSLWPVRMTIFPTEGGLKVLVPEHEATGLNVEPLKQGYESEVLLQRNFTSIREVVESVESSA